MYFGSVLSLKGASWDFKNNISPSSKAKRLHVSYAIKLLKTKKKKHFEP